MADWLVNAILRLAPWYHPDEIEAREEQTELARQLSINARKAAERAIGPSRLAAYGRLRIGR